MTDRERIFTRRTTGQVLPLAVVLSFAAINAVTAQTLATRLIQLAVCAAMGYFLARAWRAGIEVTEGELVVHDQLRARSIPWNELATARLERPPKESWFSRRRPRLVLALHFDKGGTKQFMGVWAPESAIGPLRSFVEEVNRRIKAARLARSVQPPRSTVESGAVKHREGVRSSAIGCLFLLLIIGALSLLGSNLVSDDSGEDDAADSPIGSLDTAPAPDERHAEAYDECKTLVDQQLGAPGTASYPEFNRSGGDVIVFWDAGAYSVWSHVDAEDVSGEDVRTRWICELTPESDGSWSGIATLLE